MTATLENAKMNVAMPPRFDPEKCTWMLWKPQALSCFEIVGLEGILDPLKEEDFFAKRKQVCDRRSF
jgi:hypothetical protein